MGWEPHLREGPSGVSVKGHSLGVKDVSQGAELHQLHQDVESAVSEKCLVRRHQMGRASAMDGEASAWGSSWAEAEKRRLVSWLTGSPSWSIDSSRNQI